MYYKQPRDIHLWELKVNLMMYHVCANCRARGKDKSYSYPKGWRSRPTSRGILLLCAECQKKLESGAVV